MKINQLSLAAFASFLTVSKVFCTEGVEEASRPFYKNPWVLGIVAVLALGVVGYAVYRNRNK